MHGVPSSGQSLHLLRELRCRSPILLRVHKGAHPLKLEVAHKADEVSVLLLRLPCSKAEHIISRALATRAAQCRAPMRLSGSAFSPGNPEMKVVRMARSGIRSLSLFKSVSVWSRVGRFMARRTKLLMCWRGMSMYLHTCDTLVSLIT